MMRRIKGMQLWYHSKVSNWWVAAIHVLGFSSHSDFAWIISKYCVAGANFIQKSPLWLCDNTLTQLVAILFGIHPYDTVYHNKKTTILAMVCVVCRRQSNVHFCFSPCKCCFVFFFCGKVNIVGIYPFPITCRAWFHHDHPGLAFIWPPNSIWPIIDCSPLTSYLKAHIST